MLVPIIISLKRTGILGTALSRAAHALIYCLKLLTKNILIYNVTLERSIFRLHLASCLHYAYIQRITPILMYSFEQREQYSAWLLQMQNHENSSYVFSKTSFRNPMNTS